MIPRIQIFKFISILCLFLTTGCLPETRVNSTKDSNYQIASHHLLVIQHMNTTMGEEEIRRGFNQSLQVLLQKCDVQPFLSWWPFDASNSDPQTNPRFKQQQQINAALIHQYNLDTVLLVEMKSLQYGQRFGVPGKAIRYRYDATLRTLKTLNGRDLWRSTIELLPENIRRGDVLATDKPELVGHALAETIVQQMIRDNLLPKCSDSQ